MTIEVQGIIKDLLSELVDDHDREGLSETPKRVADAFEFWLSGYGQDPASVLKTFEDGAQDYDEIIFQGGIPFFSLCEHHLAPFFGVAHIAYLPGNKIVGLSKLGRLLDIFARRLQVQERLSTQVAKALMSNLQPRGVAVVIQARHLCMESRGVRKIGSVTTTSVMLGLLREAPEVRAEFMSLLSMASAGVQLL